MHTQDELQQCSFHDKWFLTCWRLALLNPSSKSLMEILVLLECYCSWRPHFSGEHYFGSRGDGACQRAHHDFLGGGDCGCSAAGCGGCRDHTSCRDLLLLLQPFLARKRKWNKEVISIFRFYNINIVSTHYWEIKASGRILAQIRILVQMQSIEEWAPWSPELQICLDYTARIFPL